MTGRSKILVGLGWTPYSSTNNFEVLDLDSTISKCKNLPTFPMSIAGAMGGMLTNETLVICGGSSKCYTFNNAEWKLSFELKEEVIFGASTQSSNDQFLISGGRNCTNYYFKDVKLY